MKINILQVRQEVNMGDHAETVTQAVDAPDDTTIEELAKAFLRERVWVSVKNNDPKPLYDAYLVIRIAKPIEEGLVDR